MTLSIVCTLAGLAAGIGAALRGLAAAASLSKAVRTALRWLAVQTRVPLLQPHTGHHTAPYGPGYDPAAEDTRAFKAVTS